MVLLNRDRVLVRYSVSLLRAPGPGAKRLEGLIGQSVCYLEQAPEEFRATLERFISSRWQLDAVCELFAEIAAGSLAYRTETVRDLLGRAATTIESFAQRFSAVFGRDHG
jgi:hypothetical protein